MKVRVKDLIVLLGIIVLAIATTALAIAELSRIGTISGLTLIPVLAGLIWLGGSMIAKDIKSFKKLYEAADDE